MTKPLKPPKPKITAILYKDGQFFHDFDIAVGSSQIACAIIKAFKTEHTWEVIKTVHAVPMPLPSMPLPTAQPIDESESTTKPFDVEEFLKTQFGDRYVPPKVES